MSDEIVDIMNRLDKKFGVGTVVYMDDDERWNNLVVIPTGSLALDLALGVGGIPTGRITEIFGPEGAGKTTIAQEIVANAQQFFDKPAAYIDVEHATYKPYLQECGIDTKSLIFSQPPDGAAAIDIVRSLIGHTSVIVVDTVAALVGRAEIDGEPTDNHPGLQARFMSQNLKVIKPMLGLSGTALVFINQLRMKIGVKFGNPETQPGGRALKFYADIRLDVRRKGFVGPQEARTGQLCAVKAVKNKLGPPYRTAEVEITYGKGINQWADMLKIAVAEELVTKGGSYYYYDGENIGQGQKAAEVWLSGNPAVVENIREAVLTNNEQN